MNSLNLIFLLAMLMAFANITLSATSSKEELSSTNDDSYNEKQTSLRGQGRFLAYKVPDRVTITCDKYPSVCSAKGSPGPDCCKKKCVDLSSNRLNCGKCEKKCKYSEVCCKGKCVNLMFNKNNCGSCGYKCNKGSACVYGMCSYAN
ncbi:Stigma-specific STIG1-like protein [Quillaja saponaria]|uniref:Stigma-specific STIG1-like protein n=1 Tax=Quillaja saponaria TaxID=32244 RepID=A0AAD7M2A8_QUISA|nr:Stigma-specific STIG1-like protein [Quillaja saponaria]